MKQKGLYKNYANNKDGMRTKSLYYSNAIGKNLFPA